MGGEEGGTSAELLIRAKGPRQSDSSELVGRRAIGRAPLRKIGKNSKENPKKREHARLKGASEFMSEFMNARLEGEGIYGLERMREGWNDVALDERVLVCRNEVLLDTDVEPSFANPARY